MTLRRVAAFVALLLIAYLAVMFCLSGLLVGRFQVLQLVIGNDSAPGGIGHSLQRLREAESATAVDILFIGSSHAYRGFDPRIFAGLGLTSFNLGSKAQSPLNSYYLLERYWPRLRPKLVVMEVYPMALAGDGLESFFDLTVNSALSGDMLRMALAVKNPHAVNALVSAYAGQFWYPLECFEQAEIPGQAYIPGGYVESIGRPGALTLSNSSTRIDLSDAQLTYLKRIIAFVRSHGSRIILVIHPLPKQLLTRIQNYGPVSVTISAVARQLRVPFWDFNQDLDLDDERDFKDKDHLNASGVRLFNHALIDRMKREGLVGGTR